MSQEPLEAAPSRRALRARQSDADAAVAGVPASLQGSEPADQVPAVQVPAVPIPVEPVRVEPVRVERTPVEPIPVEPVRVERTPIESIPVERPSRRSLRARERVEDPGRDAVDDWAAPAQAWAEPGETRAPLTEGAASAPSLWDAAPEHWAAHAGQWSVPDPALAERWVEPDEESLESGSLIMPAGRAATGPVTPAQPYGRPAVFLDAPVQPALRPLDDLEPEPDPVRARVDHADTAPELARPRVRRAPDAVALQALALAEATAAAESASVAVVVPEGELADPLGELTLAERLASLPVAPWAVDLAELEGDVVDHPCEPVDSVPQPHAPVGDRISPVPDRVAPTSDRVGPTSDRVAPTSDRVAPTSDRVAPTSDRSMSGSDGSTPASSSVASFRPEGDSPRVPDSGRRPSAPRSADKDHPLPRASEHIPSVAAWVPPEHVVDPVAVMRRLPGPPLATWGAWLGVASVAAWFLGPIALGIGAWTMNVARQHDYSRARPLAAIVGGVLGTLLGIAFVIAWR